MICETCKPDERCWHIVSTVAPKECVPCRHCGKTDELYSELPVNGDWDGRGFVMRIGCLCDSAIRSGDDDRTDFEPYLDAIAQWNEMQADDRGDD